MFSHAYVTFHAQEGRRHIVSGSDFRWLTDLRWLQNKELLEGLYDDDDSHNMYVYKERKGSLTVIQYI